MMLSTFRFAWVSIAALFVHGSAFASTPASGHSAEHADCPFKAAQANGELPKQIGQDAFAALAEMRHLLMTDPETDWTQVDLDALREHLVDMNRVLLDAEVSVQPTSGGFEARVTGTGRTLEAIRRMVPAHARFVNGREGLRVATSAIANATGESEEGILVTVTAEASDIARVRGLGFFGFLVAGDHHRIHHRAMALGAGHP